MFQDVFDYCPEGGRYDAGSHTCYPDQTSLCPSGWERYDSMRDGRILKDVAKCNKITLPRNWTNEHWCISLRNNSTPLPRPGYLNILIPPHEVVGDNCLPYGGPSKYFEAGYLMSYPAQQPPTPSPTPSPEPTPDSSPSIKLIEAFGVVLILSFIANKFM